VFEEAVKHNLVYLITGNAENGDIYDGNSNNPQLSVISLNLVKLFQLNQVAAP
jgi:hypothetical protein